MNPPNLPELPTQLRTLNNSQQPPKLQFENSIKIRKIERVLNLRVLKFERKIIQDAVKWCLYEFVR